MFTTHKASRFSEALFRVFCSVLTVAFFVAIAHSGDAKKPRNRLANETSLYLRLHAHNPTDWYPWGPEAFEKAKKEKKLIFLSVGYSSCYWCHVMERESFNHPEVAKLLNEHFVCIKVDREERPEIDHIYMTALQSTQGRGGWPLSMFLMPDGRPTFGGTYWPREDKVIDGEKSPGFLSLIKNAAKVAREKWDEIDKAADQVAASTQRALDGAAGLGLAVVALDHKLLDEMTTSLKDEFDPDYGGFGSPNRQFRGPKFPLPGRLMFLLNEYRRTKNDDTLAMVTKTLDRMAQGGIYDHIGGGFHRYSTDRAWLIPHFEKMLYDNAQLAELYAQAYQVTKQPLYRQIAQETLAYIEREMMSPDRAFYSSQDAETHHEEGRFYVWTTRELAQALPNAADVDFIRRVYGADGTPNFEKQYHVLHLPRPLGEVAREMRLSEGELTQKLDPLRKRLYEKRAQRDRPLRNEIALTSWSGLAIAAFARAGQIFEERRYLDSAIQAASFLLKHQKTSDGRLLRTFGAKPGETPKAAIPAFLEDYAFLTHGLLNLYEATSDKKWLEEAIALTDAMIRHHGESKRGGYFVTAHDHEKLFARAKDQHDGAIPSGNSVAIKTLVRLARHTGEARFLEEADRGFRFFAGSMKSYGPALVTLGSSLDAYLELKKNAK